jgi:hypothetical protein
MDEICLPASTEFKYLGVVFDRWLTWNVKRCKTSINFMKSIAGISLGSHPDSLLILLKGLVRSVLLYGCVYFAEMAETHLKKLERVQWRGQRFSLALMQSTHMGKVEALSGVPLLDLRFVVFEPEVFVVFLCQEQQCIEE